MKNHNALIVYFAASALLGGCEKQAPQTNSPSSSLVTKEAKDDYYCPMHTTVHSDHPGECPICHMKLIKAAPSANAEGQKTTHSSPKIKFYRNPMNPAVTSPAPAKDEMGMDYIPVYETENTTTSSAIAAGRGLVTLSKDQMELARVQLVDVAKRDLILEVRAPGRIISSGIASFQIFEADVGDVRPGQTFTAISASYPARVIRGRITEVDSIVDPMTRTVRVGGTLSSGTPSLRTESSLIGLLEVPLGKKIAVAEDAVLHGGSQELVFVSDGPGRFRPTAVQLGRKAQGYYEILDGLSEGQQVSAGPNFLLDSEARVRAAQ